MLEKSLPVAPYHDETEEVATCTCEVCMNEYKSHKTEMKQDKSNCEWKNMDELRKRRYPSGNYQEFAWEINCECAGCKGSV